MIWTNSKVNSTLDTFNCWLRIEQCSESNEWQYCDGGGGDVWPQRGITRDGAWSHDVTHHNICDTSRDRVTRRLRSDAISGQLLKRRVNNQTWELKIKYTFLWQTNCGALN